MIKESKILFFILIAVIGTVIGNLQTTAFVLSICYVANLIISSKETIAFREFTLVMYAINYLFSPSILYSYNDADFLPYKMNCTPETYFSNAIPGILALHLGIFIFKTNIFTTSFSLAKVQAILNEKVLKTWMVVGLIFNLANSKLPLPSEIAFFIVLLSGLRYVGLFGLISINAKKNIYLILTVALYEFSWALANGFFHDLMIWIVFFGIYFVYLKKISLINKIIFGIAFVFFGFIVQNSKSDYRTKTWDEGAEASAGTFATIAVEKTTNSDQLYSTENLLNTLIRVNQAWIAASTIDNMDRTQDFAGTKVLYQYVEAALLPRFLAPNKLMAGDKDIFNKYSGHKIAQNTSMALGIIADGYVAYASWGVILFCFGLGLVFSIVFKIVEGWADVSPFFMLMLFPILYYAVRPDCELQTTLGQLVKGTFAFYLVVRYYRNYFEIQAKIIQKIEEYRDKLKAIQIGEINA